MLTFSTIEQYERETGVDFWSAIVLPGHSLYPNTDAAARFLEACGATDMEQADKVLRDFLPPIEPDENEGDDIDEDEGIEITELVFTWEWVWRQCGSIGVTPDRVQTLRHLKWMVDERDRQRWKFAAEILSAIEHGPLAKPGRATEINPYTRAADAADREESERVIASNDQLSREVMKRMQQDGIGPQEAMRMIEEERHAATTEGSTESNS